MNTNLEKPLIFVPRARFWCLSVTVFFLILSCLAWLNVVNMVLPPFFYAGIAIMFLVLLFPTFQTIKISDQYLNYLFFDASREIHFELCNKISLVEQYLKPRNLVLEFKNNGFKVVPKDLEALVIPIMYFHQRKKIFQLIVEHTKNRNPEVEIDPRILQEIQS